MADQHLKNSCDTFPEENFLRGAFQISRSIYRSEVWFKDPDYLKLWLWMIGQANHQTTERDGLVYPRGELYTTYERLGEALKKYRHNKKEYPTLKKVRVMLDWFSEKRMIERAPVKRC